MSDAGGAGKRRRGNSWRALRHRNYRLFFGGQAVSLVGTWMTRLATSWLVYRLTNDPFMLGAVNFASLVPAFALGPIAGAIVDRSDVRRLLVITQVIAMLQSFGLAAVSVAGLSPHLSIMLLLALSVVQGLVNAFDMPGRQVLLTRMITDRQDLPNGIALNSSLLHGARLVGPSIAGIVIALVGETWCFTIDGFSYIGVVMALVAMHLPQRAETGRSPESLWTSFTAGWRYAFGVPPIRALLVLVAVVSLMGMPHTVLLPVYAKDVFGGGAATLGWLTSASGLGALLGATQLARRESPRGLGKVIAIAGATFAVCLVGFAYSRLLSLSLALLAGVGFGMITQTASTNTILQTLVEEDKRGRVMSLYTSAFVGMAPFGGLLVGWLARRIGAPASLTIGAVACGLSTAVFAIRLPALKSETEKPWDGESKAAEA